MPPEELQKTENPEQKEQNNTSTTNGGSFVETLEKKFPGEENKSKRDQLLPLFENAKQYWDTENINNFIQNGLKSKGINTLLNDPNKQKTIIDQIDVYLENKGIKKNIITYQNIVEEKQNIVEEKQNIVEEKQNIVEEKQNIVEEKQEKTTTEQETIENKQQTIKQTEKEITLENTRKQVEEDYKNLDPSLKPNQDDQIKSREELEKSGTLNKLRQKGLSQEQIDNYINYNFTATYKSKELQQTPQGKKFLESFNTLNDQLIPPPRNLDGLTGERGIRNADTVIQNNKDIQNFSNNQDNFKNLDTPKFLENISYQTLYKFLDQDTKNQLHQEAEKITTNNPNNQEFFDKDLNFNIEKIKKLDTINIPKEIEDYNNLYLTTLNNFQEQFKQSTEQIMRQRITMSTISGLGSYFDSTNINTQENYTQDFNLDVSKDIQINKEGILRIQGSINGKNVGMNYNILQSDNLQADDYLHLTTKTTDTADKTPNSGGYEIGKSTEKLPIILPSMTELSNQANNWNLQNNILETSNSLEEYQNNLKEGLSKHLNKSFGSQDLVKVRLERNTQKNIASQEVLNMIQNTLSLDGRNIFEKTINRNENPEAFKLMKTLDDTMDSYTIDELTTFRNNIQRLNTIITQTKNGKNQKEKLFQLFNQDNCKESFENRTKTNKQTNFGKFFSIISERKNGKKIINLNEFDKILDIGEKNESIENNKQKFAILTQERYETSFKEDPNSYLANQLTTLPDNPIT